MFCGMFFTLSMNDGILCRILSIPHNIVMAMNNVMLGRINQQVVVGSKFLVDALYILERHAS